MSTSSKTVLCHGVFDLLHPGHVQHLEAARALGDRLVVSVTADNWVNKGPGRPILKASDRAAMLGALRCVDETVITDAPSAVPTIIRYKPDVYAKGWEYKSVDVAWNLQAEIEAVTSVGGTVVFTDQPTMSSSSLLNRAYPNTADDFLKQLRTRLTFANVQAAFEKVKDLSITAAGEPITDTYVYVSPAQKAPKDNLVTFIDGDSDTWEGGIDVIASHLRSFTGQVKVANGGLLPIVKRRYVEKVFNQKVFHDVVMPASQRQNLTVSGMVIAADFGHGLWANRDQAAATRNQTDWLGLTVQSNSLNWGFNVVSKWPRADYVVLDKAEAQLALHEQLEPEVAIIKIATMMHASTVVITLGHEGIIIYSEGRTHRMPALSTVVLDRMGAGDAFLAWSAPFVYARVPTETAMFIGSCAAAIKVSRRGNPALSKAEVLGMAKAVLA